MGVFDFMEKFGHEQVIFFYDKTAKLKGITAIHDTTLGPALGGTRLYDYKNEEDALFDVIRLSRGMTYKCSAANLNAGGGKSVLIGAPSVKNEAYLRAYGRFVQALNGRFYTGEDMNINEHDVDYMLMESDYLVGRTSVSGNPSPYTAYGVYWGIKAAAFEKWGNNSLTGKTVAIQGVGAVGQYLCKFLHEEGANLIVSDINQDRVSQMVEKYQAKAVSNDEIFQVKCDIFSPNAIGAILNDETIPKLQCEIIAGGANNVLLNEIVHGDMLMQKNILYAPDFVINGGGAINVYQEFHPPYNAENAYKVVARIYERLLEIFKNAKANNLNTQIQAIKMAEERVERLRQVRANFIPNEKNL